MSLDYEIEYKPGTENKVADVLSRHPTTTQLLNLVLTAPANLDREELQRQVLHDPVLSVIVGELEKEEGSADGYHIKEGTLYKEGRIVIPQDSPIIPKLLEMFHSSYTGGHGGVLKSFKRLTSEVYWKGMRKDLVECIKGCQVCRQNKYSTLTPTGLLSPLPIPTQIWSNISLDFIEGLPLSKSFDVILVVVDRLSKYAHFIPLKHPFTTRTVADVFLKEVVKHHGFPETMVSDRDKIFVSNFWSELFLAQGTTLHKSSAYHSQTDGHTEVLNRCLETYLRCFVSGKPKLWVQMLMWAEFSYNTSFHTAIQMTPFQTVYGREPPRFLRFGDVPTTNAQVEELLKERDALIKTLRENLQLAQARMQKSANKHRRELQFNQGDWFYLKLRPYRQSIVAQRRNEKLAPRFFSPYQVIQRIGKVAYKLQLPQGSAIHPVVQVSLLKQALPSCVQVQTLPEILNSNLEWETEPTSFLAVRDEATGDDQEVIIKWRGLPDCENTWEPLKRITNPFPQSHLVDKVTQIGEGIDKVATQGEVHQREVKLPRKRAP